MIAAEEDPYNTHLATMELSGLGNEGRGVAEATIFTKRKMVH